MSSTARGNHRLAAGGPQVPLTGAPDWWQETDPVKLRKNYANANAYEVYPTYVCLTALRCSAQIADALPDAAAKWRRYADRLESGMLRLLAVGEFGSLTWRLSRHSVYPSGQGFLVQAWFAFYFDAGSDPTASRRRRPASRATTLRRQLSLPCAAPRRWRWATASAGFAKPRWCSTKWTKPARCC